MLTRLKIHRYRNVRPGTELVFNEKVNILLGRNGTGKTTLLCLLSVILRSDYSGLRGEEFDLEYEFSRPYGNAYVRVGNKLFDLQAPSSLQRQNVASVRARLNWTYESPSVFEFEMERSTTRWRLDSGPWQDGKSVDVLGVPLPFAIEIASRSGEGRSDARVFVLPLEISAYRFDESIETFRSITEGLASSDSLGVAPPLQVETSFDSNGSSSSTISGLQHLGIVGKQPEPGSARAAAEIRWPSPLVKFVDLAGLASMKASLSVEGSRRDNGRVWWRLGAAEFFFTEPGGSSFNHKHLSYGQKRLLAFLFYLGANGDHVIADELVNGMHHEWIRACLDEIGDRQSFLTSQNPLLLDYVPIETAEDAHKTFISCRSELVDGHTEFVWSNLALDDATELVMDLKAGIQPLGEILRVRGLW